VYSLSVFLCFYVCVCFYVTALVCVLWALLPELKRMNCDLGNHVIAVFSPVVSAISVIFTVTNIFSLCAFVIYIINTMIYL